MRASKFSDAQKAYVVKRGEEGVPVADLCREAGTSEATYFNWRKSETLSPPLVRGVAHHGRHWFKPNGRRRADVIKRKL